MGRIGRCIILSGPSGVGKGSILKELFKDPTLRLNYSISMTTRSMRAGETNGKEYFFVSREEFEDAIITGQLLEYAEFVGNLYGTPLKYVNDILLRGDNVLLEIEVNGQKQVIEKLPNAVTIFIVPPNLEALEARIRGRRSEPEPIVQQRLNKAKNELLMAKDYQYVVVNDELSKTTMEIAKIIHKIEKENTNA
jgi:guanylate kinase